MSHPRRVILTDAALDAISSALDAALAGAGFDGGDFDGQDPEQFERANAWVAAEQRRRAKRKLARERQKQGRS